MRDEVRTIVGIMLVLSCLLLIAPFASQYPDALERVAQKLNFASYKKELFSAPMPGYLFPYIRNRKLAIYIAGTLGTILVLALTTFLAKLLKK